MPKKDKNRNSHKKGQTSQQSAGSSRKMQPPMNKTPVLKEPCSSGQQSNTEDLSEQHQGGSACAAAAAATVCNSVVEKPPTGEDCHTSTSPVRKSDSESGAAHAGIHNKNGKSVANKSPSDTFALPTAGVKSCSPSLSGTKTAVKAPHSPGSPTLAIRGSPPGLHKDGKSVANKSPSDTCAQPAAEVKPCLLTGTKTAVTTHHSPGSPTLATQGSSPGLPTSISNTTKVSDNSSALADTTTMSATRGTGSKDVGKDKKSPSSPTTDGFPSSRPNREKADDKKNKQAKVEDDKEMVKKQREHYLAMSLDEKRKKYACGDHYLTLHQIPTWPDYFTGNRADIAALKPPKGKKSRKNLKIDYKRNDNFNRRVSMFRCDITTLEIDCIVNAANSSLLGGGGVDGAIHDAAGYFLYDECVTLKGCKTGEAKLTAGYNLPARYVVHTVGPIGEHPADLQSCYSRCLRIVEDLKLKSIAFPCISTGIYGYPNESAVHVVLRTVREWMENMEKEKKLADIDRVIFCLFMKDSIDLYAYWMQFYFPLPGVDLPTLSEQCPAGSVEKKGNKSPRKLFNFGFKGKQDGAAEGAKSSNDATSDTAGVGAADGAADACAVAAITSDSKYRPTNPVAQTTLKKHHEEGATANGGTSCSETAAEAKTVAVGVDNDSREDKGKGAEQSGKGGTAAFGGVGSKTEVKDKDGKVPDTKGNEIDGQGKPDDVYSKNWDPSKRCKMPENVKDDKSKTDDANNGKAPASPSRFIKMTGSDDKQEYAAGTKKEELDQRSVTDSATIVAAAHVGDDSKPIAESHL